MNKKVYLHRLGHAFKLFLLGSFVASRTASGAPGPDDSLRHELAWMNVRDGLSETATDTPLSNEVRQIVEQDTDKDLELRVANTYRVVSPDNVAALDALWMDHLIGAGVAADEIDRFVEARTAALREYLQGDAATTPDTVDEIRGLVRQFSVGTYE